MQLILKIQNYIYNLELDKNKQDKLNFKYLKINDHYHHKTLFLFVMNRKLYKIINELIKIALFIEL